MDNFIDRSAVAAPASQSWRRVWIGKVLSTIGQQCRKQIRGRLCARKFSVSDDPLYFAVRHSLRVATKTITRALQTAISYQHIEDLS